MKVTIKLKQGRCMTLLQLGVVAYNTKCKQLYGKQTAMEAEKPETKKSKPKNGASTSSAVYFGS